jgi:hypothetical protein
LAMTLASIIFTSCLTAKMMMVLSANLLILKLLWVLWEKCDDYVISHVSKLIHVYYYAPMFDIT